MTGAGADALVRERVRRSSSGPPRPPAPSRSTRCPDRIAALQDELRETKRRLKAGGGAGIAAARRARRRGRRRSRPGVRLVAYAGPYESMEALKAAATDVSAALGSGVIALGLDADEPQLFVTV